MYVFPPHISIVIRYACVWVEEQVTFSRHVVEVLLTIPIVGVKRCIRVTKRIILAKIQEPTVGLHVLFAPRTVIGEHRLDRNSSSNPFLAED